MSVFAIIAVHGDDPELEREIEGAFPGSANRVASNVWFVSSANTAIGIAEAIGAGREARHTGVIVVQCAPAYYGRASSAVWDWLRSAFEKPENG